MKVAIFYDWLNQWGGAEKVLLDILAIYPTATLFTLVYDPQKTSWLPPKIKVITTPINNWLFSKSNPIVYTGVYDFFLEQFDFSSFDVVISTTSVLGHCLLTPPTTLFITYFHNINRHLYLRSYLKFYQNIDKIYSHRPDYLFCNSQTVSQRIFECYQRKATVVNPGVDSDFFIPVANKPDDYFLIVGRLVAHKKFDLAIHACGQLGINLKIVGHGRDLKYLKLISKQYRNIEFLGPVNNTKLLTLYQHCQALICPQIEDYGIAPLECQSCGRPVIAFNQGGITETILNHQTGLFFDHQTVSSLEDCLLFFLTKNFSAKACRDQALKFSKATFMLNFKKQIDTLWQKHQSTLL